MRRGGGGHVRGSFFLLLLVCLLCLVLVYMAHRTKGVADRERGKRVRRLAVLRVALPYMQVALRVFCGMLYVCSMCTLH